MTVFHLNNYTNISLHVIEISLIQNIKKNVFSLSQGLQVESVVGIPGDSLLTDWTFSVAICSLHDFIHTFVTEHMTTLS